MINWFPVYCNNLRSVIVIFNTQVMLLLISRLRGHRREDVMDEREDRYLNGCTITTGCDLDRMAEESRKVNIVVIEYDLGDKLLGTEAFLWQRCITDPLAQYQLAIINLALPQCHFDSVLWDMLYPEIWSTQVYIYTMLKAGWATLHDIIISFHFPQGDQLSSCLRYNAKNTMCTVVNGIFMHA